MSSKIIYFCDECGKKKPEKNSDNWDITHPDGGPLDDGFIHVKCPKCKKKHDDYWTKRKASEDEEISNEYFSHKIGRCDKDCDYCSGKKVFKKFI